MTTPTIPDYVTKSELDVRLNFRDQLVDTKLEALRELLDERLVLMQATVERGVLEHKVIAGEMRSEVNGLKAEISEIRGDVKALNARVSALESKIGWYLTLFGIGITVVIGVLQMLPK